MVGFLIAYFFKFLILKNSKGPLLDLMIHMSDEVELMFVDLEVWSTGWTQGDPAYSCLYLLSTFMVICNYLLLLLLAVNSKSSLLPLVSPKIALIGVTVNIIKHNSNFLRFFHEIKILKKIHSNNADRVQVSIPINDWHCKVHNCFINNL